MEHDPPEGAARCLRLHTTYRCRHSGACCTAGWAIPVEGPAFERLRVHFGSHKGGDALFATGGPLPEGAAAVLGVARGGSCVFFEPSRGNLCAVHRELGARTLPIACRQFPRVMLQDGRGISITLSHYCPTAAGLLRLPDTAAFDIVRAPASIALDDDLEGHAEGAGGLEGLDAREALPPLLAPGLLTDLDGYDAWERRAIALLSRPTLSPDAAIEAIAAATARVQTWRPGGGSLRDAVHREFDVASPGKPDEDLGGIVRRAALARQAVPPGLSSPPADDDFHAGWPEVAAWWSDFDATIRGYLAARLFGNWIAYYGQGLHVIVEYLRVVLATVKMEAVRHAARHPSTSPWQTVNEAVRHADLLLVHLADARSLTRLLP